MTAVPDYVPLLVKGASDDPKEGGCLVQIANWLADPTSWTDHPECVFEELAEQGIWINDNVDDPQRHRLALQAPRIAGTRIYDLDLAGKIQSALEAWYVENPKPYKVVHTNVKWTGEGLQKQMEIFLSGPKLTGTTEEAVTWYERLVDEYHRLAGTQPIEIPAERWLEVKEHVSQ